VSAALSLSADAVDAGMAPDSRTLTATVVAAALAGAVAPGFQTPSTLFGPDFMLGLEGIFREDETGSGRHVDRRMS
jgi:hypothetical protein